MPPAWGIHAGQVTGLNPKLFVLRVLMFQCFRKSSCHPRPGQGRQCLGFLLDIRVIILPGHQQDQSPQSNKQHVAHCTERHIACRLHPGPPLRPRRPLPIPGAPSQPSTRRCLGDNGPRGNDPLLSPPRPQTTSPSNVVDSRSLAQAL